MYKVLIVDDEALARTLLVEHVSKIPQLEVAGTCKTALEAQAMLHEKQVDILLLDIHMPDLTGMEFLRMMKQRPATILTTAYADYALEGYELEIVDYLLKPIVFGRFFQAISRAMDRLSPATQAPVEVEAGGAILPKQTQRNSLFVKTDSRLVQLAYADILYIEGLREYIQIKTKTDKLVVLQSLSRLMEALPPQQFARVHRSYIVNITHIDSIIGNTIYIGGAEVPISKGKKEGFLSLINRDGLF